MKNVELSLVIPVFNEEANIEELVDRCVSVCSQINKPYEIVLVDDGSSDRSVELMKEKAALYAEQLQVVVLNRNYGQHSAVLAGLAASSGAVVVTLDADLQNPPEEIPKLLELVDEGCDVVGSVRMNRQDSLFRRLSSNMINRAVRKATGVDMHDYGCMLRAYRRHIVDAVLSCTERSTFIPILANSFASKTGEVNVEHAARSNDESKYDLWNLINLQFDLLTTMSTFPLRMLSLAGGSLAILGFLSGVFLLLMRLIYGSAWAADGVFTIFAGLFLFAGVQLLGMGLMGEYLGRVYNDVRSRPRYFVKETIKSTHADRQSSQPRVVSVNSRDNSL